MKLKPLYTMIALMGLSLSSTVWAQEYEDASDQEPMELLASIGDASESAAVADLAAADAQGELTADDEELAQVCEQSAQEAGVEDDAIDAFVEQCVSENGNTLVDEQDASAEAYDDQGEVAAADGEYVEGDEQAEANTGEGDYQQVADTGEADNAYAMTAADEQ